MVMPKKGERDVRREQFPVRWSLDELYRLKANASARGMQPSAYLRWLVHSDRIRNNKAAPGGNPTRP